MTASCKYDPAEAGARARRNRFYPLRAEDLERFGPKGLWQAGTEQLRTAVRGLMVGEAVHFEDVIASAARLLSAPGDQGMPWGDDWKINLARHRNAQALVNRLLGHVDRDAWQVAADAYDAAIADVALEERGWWLPSAAVCHALAGAPIDFVAPHIAKTPVDAALMCVLAAGPEADSFGPVLVERAPDLFSETPDLDHAGLLLHLIGDIGGLSDAKNALLAQFVLDPSLSLPPALKESGWSETGEAIVVLPGRAFAPLARLLPTLGLARDGAAGNGRDVPALASWTRQPDLLVELDWCAREGEPPYLELRGTLAGRMGAFLARALGGQLRQGPEAALADLLTVPPRSEPAHRASAEARWAMICDTVLHSGLRDDTSARALLAASLKDSDWRVRMAALWGIGHHRIQGLSALAEASALPKTGFRGLSQDDRRVLLALRDLVAGRSAGLPDRGKPGANAGFVAEVAGHLDTPPRADASRGAALISALLQRPAPSRAPPMPSAWAQWTLGDTD